MMPVTTTSTLKNITISDCPLITSLSFNVSSDDYKVAFASGGKLDLGGLQSLKSIECNTSVKGLDTLIVPTSLTDLRFTTEHGDGINEIKNIWSANAVHNNDGFEGIDFQDMTIEFIDMLGLNSISNAINFHIAPKTQNPNLNTARDGSASKPWFHPTGSIDLSNYTGLMIGMLRGVDLNKLDVVINTDRDQVDLTSLFECATLPTAQNIVAKTNNILAKFPKSVIWDYMFKGCDLSFSPKDIRIPNRGLSLKGMYKDSNVTEDVSLPNVIMAVDEMFMNCIGITTYEKNWLKTYSKVTYTVPTSNGTSGSWDDSGNYTEGTNYNQFLYTPSEGEKAFKIMTTGTGIVRINYFYNASFISRVVYTPEFDSYPYVVTIPDGCNKIIFVCDKTIRFASEGTITTNNCYTNTGGALSEIPTSWGGYGLDKNVTSIYVIDTTHLTNTTTFNLVLQDNQAGITDWGDGVTNSEKSHTYAEHGTYTIKTKSWSNGTPSDDLKTALIEVKQIKLIGHNGNSKDYSNSFNGCGKLTKVTAYDLAPTNCDSMFSNCSSLTEIIGMETWDMSNCTSVANMFSRTSKLTNINGAERWVLSSCRSIQEMFSSSGITSLNVTNWNMGSCTNMKLAFNWANDLSEIVGLENWNVNNVTIYEGMFNHCISLSEFEIFSPINYYISFNLCPLTVDTLVKILNALGEVSKTQTLTLGETNLAKLTDEQKMIAINKGWFLEGYSMVKIPAGADISAFTTNNDVTKVYVELTSENATNRIAELYTKFPNITEIYLFEDGSITEAVDIFTGVDNSAKAQITKVVFLEGYFNNVTLDIREYGILDELPTAWGGFGFSKDKTVIAELTIPSDNYTITLGQGYVDNKAPYKGMWITSFGDGNYDYSDNSNINNKISHTYAKAGTYVLKTHRLLYNIDTPSRQAFTKIINVHKYLDVWGIIEHCIGFTNLIEADLSNLAGIQFNAKGMFKGCSKLVKVIAPNFTPTNCSNMFINCSSLTEIVGVETWNMSNCTNVDYMFRNCTNLINLNIPDWNVSKISTFAGAFLDCRNLSVLNVSNWRPINVSNMQTMFRNCSKLTELNISNWGTLSKVSTLYSTFNGCSSLTELVLPTFTSTLTDMETTFAYCTNLTTLDISNCDLSNVVFRNTFNTTTNLTNINSGTNISNDIMFSNCNKLTVTSLLSIINNLATVTNSKTLTLGSTNLAKLTDGQIAIATNKGWTLQ